MNYGKKIYLDIFYIIVGAVLLGCGIAEVVDSFWSGMGGALIAVGAVRIAQQIKFRKNPEYREKIEIESKDERNRFIALRAWAWSGYAFVIISAVGTIGFKIAGNDLLSQFCAYAVCLVIILYWISYMLLRRKY
ncbi:MAG: hypothetical protein IJP05_07565 [Oscillospiraceae bacterium]|nr:hypothetical protein [Oscillospiraceae bacterium]